LNSGQVSGTITANPSSDLVLPTTVSSIHSEDSLSGVSYNFANDGTLVGSANLQQDESLPRPTITSVEVDGASLDPNSILVRNVLERDIRFTFTVQPQAGQIFESFRCRVLGDTAHNSFTNCSSPQTYNELQLGLKTFEVRAVFTVNGISVESQGDTFRWRIVTTIPAPDVPGEASDVAQETEETETINQALANEDYAEGQLNAFETSEEQVKNAQDIADFINPPFKICDENTDYAVYNVHGSADLNDLFGSVNGISPSGQDNKKSTTIPVALIVFNDLAPHEHKNIILNNNQPFMRAELVAFPGNPSEQTSINYEIKKVTTDCKQNYLVDPAQNLGSEDNVNLNDGGESPATIKPRAELNPPFTRCEVPEGGGSKKLDKDIESEAADESILSGSNQLTALQNDLIRSDSETLDPIAGLSADAATQLQLNEELGESADNEIPSTLTEEVGQTEGKPTDVAKYIIAGTMDLNGISFEDGMQDTVIRLYNIFDPTKAPQFATANTVNSNNLFMTARLEANPGDTDSWEIVFMVLGEVSTECLQIPFVSSPKTIGTGGSDFFVTELG
jgi:hypothetical protein